jgi:transposase
MTSMTSALAVVTVGVDTHSDTHHAAVIDQVGRKIADASFVTSGSGYQALVEWARSHGQIQKVGVEGTGAYGAGLARHLRAAGFTVVEVDRPDRRTRRHQGKSDPVDAYAAAAAALSGTASGTPKTRDGRVEAIRTLRIARRSAVKARTQAINQLKATVLTGPVDLREALRGLRRSELLQACRRLRPTSTPLAELDDPVLTVLNATKSTLRRLARRISGLQEEIDDIDADLAPLVAATAPRLLEVYGVGTEVAAQLLTSAGDNPDRLHSEAAFASLCGVAPLPASSGRTTRHRLNRGGDRHANYALHVIALVRLSWHEPTRAHAQRRTAEGLSKPEIIRCLKRYIAREIHHALTA